MSDSKPTTVESLVISGPAGSEADDLRRGTAIWSFGSSTPGLVVTGRVRRPSRVRAQPNANGAETAGDIQAFAPIPAFETIREPSKPFGFKAWVSAAHWEGEVEEVSETGFRARLTRIVEGRPDHTKVEFADFDFDELAYDDDRHFIEPGGVIYWTVGRHRAENGMVTNQSLVRVRRIPPPSQYRRKAAADEAARLVGDEPGRQ
jgi:hypothetical protein